MPGSRFTAGRGLGMWSVTTGVSCPGWCYGKACRAQGTQGRPGHPRRAAPCGPVPARASPVKRNGQEPRCTPTGQAQGLREPLFSAAVGSCVIYQRDKGRQNPRSQTKGALGLPPLISQWGGFYFPRNSGGAPQICSLVSPHGELGHGQGDP